MRALFLAATLGLAVSAHAQIVGGTVDILSPGDEGYEGIPANLLVLDVFIDVAETDTWTAAGILMQTQQGAEFGYFDADPITPGVQPGIFNPGFEYRFLSFVSTPFGRNAIDRFGPGGGGVAQPPNITDPTLLSVDYLVSPPATSGSPSVDGYIARIAVDLSATPYRPDDLIVTHTRPELFILECDRISAQPGFVWTTFDVPQLGGIDFWVTVPEPATSGLSLFALTAACRGARRKRRLVNHSPSGDART